MQLFRAWQSPSEASSAPATWRWLRYAAMSAVVFWHTLAMVVAPAPESALSDKFRALLGSYLSLLGIDHGWSFFAPNVENGVIFRYEIKAADGAQHIYTPSETFRWYHPDRRWNRDRYRGMLEEPERYGDVVGQALCREHADLKPVSVTLIEVEQKDFDPKDRIAGKTPLDPEFLETKAVKTVSCLAP